MLDEASAAPAPVQPLVGRHRLVPSASSLGERRTAQQRTVPSQPLGARDALRQLYQSRTPSPCPRLRVASAPLERDEGEYAYAGQLILQGIPPYRQVYNMKFPGTYYAYSVIMALLGQNPSGIRTGLLLVNVASVVPLFLIARRLTGDLAAAVTGASFVLRRAARDAGIILHIEWPVSVPSESSTAIHSCYLHSGEV